MARARPAPGGGRLIEVAPERLGRWLDGVADRHGAFTEVVLDEQVVQVTCADDTRLTLRPPFPWIPGPALLTTLTTQAQRRHRTAVLLVRRGRWAVGVFDGTELVVSKVDSRLVQGRTAAGGWSQQRFARRRGNQTDSVVRHAADTAARVLLPHATDVEVLAAGGDRGLVTEVLADPRLARLATLPRARPLEVGEPTKEVLLATPEQVRAVVVHLVEPQERDRGAATPKVEG